MDTPPSLLLFPLSSAYLPSLYLYLWLRDSSSLVSPDLTSLFLLSPPSPPASPLLRMSCEEAQLHKERLQALAVSPAVFKPSIFALFVSFFDLRSVCFAVFYSVSDSYGHRVFISLQFSISPTCLAPQGSCNSISLSLFHTHSVSLYIVTFMFHSCQFKHM